ncbi:hypothetical protein [Paractinoplanes toevensis]|uniref:Uncharacterized protein n=1 Tax=Paractinoplanes toevensis TaxID=571911 RepID=A0A919W429_9ACTN|nr:hypothetical protein [Actinoplanes toevensis]GIM91145.1 hypothetical protein Ato02nite_029380 [Actinoplanes toevensis]
MIRELALPVVIVALVLPAAGCEERATATAAVVDNQAQQACDTLAAGYPKSPTVAKRLALADRVYRWSARSDNPAIADQGSAVGHAANDSDRSWRQATARFLKICRQAGWKSR